MSGIAVVLGADVGAPGATPEWMLSALAGADDRRVMVGGDERARLAATVPAGAMIPDVFGTDAHGRIVVADARLYYRDDLLRALRAAGVATSAQTVSELLLAAYDAWGATMAAHLEGDFAFALWDAPRGRLVVARDFSGRRPLYYAECGETLLVASGVECLLAHPRCSPELDLAAIAATAAALLESPGDTAYRAVRVLGAGSTLTASIDASAGRADEAQIDRHWTAPTFERGDGVPFERAADELRATIVAAVAERLDEGRPTSVWLSGGWDSTAVFAGGFEALRSEAASRTTHASLRAVSVSYPPDDPAREDEVITAVAAHWQTAPLWCEVAPAVFGDAVREAATRSLPFVHPYAQWTRTLAAASASAGARVALDGTGGDQLFQVSPVYAADLLVRGRWLALHREWRSRAMRGSGWRRFARYAVLPWMPAWMLRAAATLRGGRPVHGLRSRELPPWITPVAVRMHDLEARATLRMRRRPGESQSALESRWYFESGYSPAILAEQSAAARAAGVELRSPLYDGRVVALAARRPREERSSGGETKRLLRAAMRGLLPDEVLAPRPRRTGTTAAFFRRAMERELPALAGCVLESSRLAEHGIVDPAAFAAAMDRYLRGGDARFDVALFQTVQTELWLRAREQSGGSLASADAVMPALSLPS